MPGDGGVDIGGSSHVGSAVPAGVLFRAVETPSEHGEVRAVEGEAALVVQPAFELVGQRGRRVDDRPAVVADDVDVVVLGRAVGRSAVVEVGVAHHAEFFEHVLRRNLKLYGAAFAIGAEDAVFLVGQFPNTCITDDELDRIVGSVYAYVEQFFRPAMRIGYAGKFKG